MEHSILAWVLFISSFLILIFIDLGVTKFANFDPKKHSAPFSVFYVGCGLLFGAYIYFCIDYNLGSQYFTGFLIEKTLSLDNIFIIYIIFQYFKIDIKYQHKALFIGILSVLVLRAVLIWIGSVIVTKFEFIMYIFGFILIVTGLKMLVITNKSLDLNSSKILGFIKKKLEIVNSQTKFYIIENRQLKLTTLTLALIMIEIVDIIFAIDSIPAIFMITNDKYIIYTSNMFAVLGLRSLYFVLADMVQRFKYLKYSLAILLVFIGSKIFLKHYISINNTAMLTITVTILGLGLLWSVIMSRYSNKNY